jgi:hypothetical protein
VQARAIGMTHPRGVEIFKLTHHLTLPIASADRATVSSSPV